MFSNRLLHYLHAAGIFTAPPPTLAASLVGSWCGMRGLVTLATALALPSGFPSRDLIIFSALSVVLGTLVVQGLTLGPLIRLLKFERDKSLKHDIDGARLALIDTALHELEPMQDSKGAATLRVLYRGDRELAIQGLHPREASEIDTIKRLIIKAKRTKLAAMRRSGAIDDDVFHVLEEELDWAELGASPPGQFEIVEG